MDTQQKNILLGGSLGAVLVGAVLVVMNAGMVGYAISVLGGFGCVVYIALNKLKQKKAWDELKKDGELSRSEAVAAKEQAKQQAFFEWPSVQTELRKLWDVYARPQAPLKVPVLGKQYLPDTVCDCWVDKETLYLLHDEADLKQKVSSYPAWFEDEEKTDAHIYRLALPLGSIAFFCVQGELYHTTELIPGKPAEGFVGVSVNGIGFGEIQSGAPDRLIDTKHDERRVALAYQTGDGHPLEVIYLDVSSYEVLQRLIPDKAR